MLALLKLELLQKKVLIFVNTIDLAFRIRLFLEKVLSSTRCMYVLAELSVEEKGCGPPYKPKLYKKAFCFMEKMCYQINSLLIVGFFV
jgi:hypothetical protein